ncbi:hypothetical protein ELI30_08975 [Rhizobium leguminosarum]|uniref:hypothetical protein n=1 Tax=Rhizobium leguminosarum TaxID=384 RepID=UPI0010322E25|nr:hypothetical protein [Rhizobium leguminosarum]TAV48423.1 hypothetical protein ELI32_09430 [Rhizobium leguminosarum]TAV57923.1 hypothetical protein ELI31_08960 [Rhizobium leguminosarum]TAV68863.1 hypothetical protein ELI30_08975 [Rhizobium leguminosarum]
MTFISKVYVSWAAIRGLPYFSWLVLLHAFWIGGLTYQVTITNHRNRTEKTFRITKGEIKLISER